MGPTCRPDIRSNGVCLSAMCNLQRNDDGANNVRVDDAAGRGPLPGRTVYRPHREHGSTDPRVHGSTGPRAWERPSAGRGWRRAFPMPGTRRRNVSFDPHAYERTAPPIIESEFLQSNNRGAVQLRPRGRTSPCSRCKRKGRAGNQLPCPAFLLAYRGFTSCAARSRFGFRDGGTASIPLPRA